MLYNNVLEAVGNTPLIRLNRVVPDGSAEVYVKFEAVNVGGSIKTRTALNMIQNAIDKGLIQQDTVIIEPTSGNQGIAIALVGAVLGYRVIIIMPDSVSVERRKLVEHYGAEVILIHDEGDIGSCIEGCIRKAEELYHSFPDAYLPQQFKNPDNPAVHYKQTGKEILEESVFAIDGVGTGGCLSGVGLALKEKNPAIEIWAVEPEHAAILSGQPVSSHIQMGIGDGLIPENLDCTLYTDVCIVSDHEALSMSQRLAKEEGLLCGISSGSNVSAALRLAQKLGPGKRVVTLIPDTGERYFSTELFG